MGYFIILHFTFYFYIVFFTRVMRLIFISYLIIIAIYFHIMY